MSEQRTITVEALAAALLWLDPLHERKQVYQGWAAAIFAALPAEPAGARLREDHALTYCEPCSECEAKLRALAATPVGGLDVERLARAIDVADPHSRIFGDESSPSGRRPTMQERLADAAAIAAAYESDG